MWKVEACESENADQNSFHRLKLSQFISFQQPLTDWGLMALFSTNRLYRAFEKYDAVKKNEIYEKV